MSSILPCATNIQYPFVHEVVHHDGAAHGRDAHGDALDAQLVDALGNEAVDDAVRAARAVVEDGIGKRMRTGGLDGLALGDLRADALLLVVGKRDGTLIGLCHMRTRDIKALFAKGKQIRWR